MMKKIVSAVLVGIIVSCLASPARAAGIYCSEQLVDIVIMLDRSSSIDRATELPAEAAAAKALLDTFISLNLGHKVAVGAFSSTATILAGGNLTTDYAALKTVIDTQLNINTSGTNIEDAIQKSEVELNTGVNPLKFIVFISDGDPSRANTAGISYEQAAINAATVTKSHGVRIISVAYDNNDGSQTAIDGRALLATLASGASVDNTVGAVSVAERDQENSDGDDFFVAPSLADLNGVFINELSQIFVNISELVACNDNDVCTDDVCDVPTGLCNYNGIDLDADVVLDCHETCPDDPFKTAPGQCGCGVADTDTDLDGSADCVDQCAADVSKTVPGICGCGIADTDSDGDGVADCNDQCPAAPDLDSDGDGTLDCQDQCPADLAKIAPGQCGCGAADTDTDLDGSADCVDQCAADVSKTVPGICGCGVSDDDSDADTFADCVDLCPADPDKTAVGDCGCGVLDEDLDANGTTDCLEVAPPPPGPVPPPPPKVTPDPEDPAPTPDPTDNKPNPALDPATCASASDEQLAQDSDDDGSPDCEELELGTNPSSYDVTVQGSATNLSAGCQLSAGAKAQSSSWVVLLIGVFALLLKRARKHALLGLLVFFSLSGNVFALDVQKFTAPDLTGVGFDVSSTTTLPQRQIAAGFLLNYVEKPLEAGRRKNDKRILGIVDRYVTADFVGTFGLTDDINFTIDLPLNFYHNIAPTLIPSRDTGGPDLGDLQLSAKWRVLNPETSEKHWGFALMPLITLPTGDEDIHFGEKNLTGGLNLIGEKIIGPQNLFANLGVRFREEETIRNLVVGHEMLFGFGYQRLLSEKHAFSALAEIQGSTTFRHFLSQEISSPAELHLVAQKDWRQERDIRSYGGVGFGLTNGYGAPDYRLFAGVSANFALPKKSEKPAKVVAAPAPEPVVETFVETVYFALNKDVHYNANIVNVESAAAFWKKYPERVIDIVGFTDAIADNSYNEKLSLRRAQHVKNELIALGVPAEKISMAYQGEENPVGDNETEAGRQKNRRVEIQIR